jgi:hypothetical protein
VAFLLRITLWSVFSKMGKIKRYSHCISCRQTKHRIDFRLDSHGYLKGRVCNQCRIEAYCKKTNNDVSYRRYKKDYCEQCGVKYHKCQLDVDHIDGKHGNNAVDNLQTLCANCHRLKSYNQRMKNKLALMSI